ncbi:MAG TPA: ThuA domain-containing protein [Terriglobales bacterium]|nr:ThuA domain-containing protein [Terriglobales bacterium]
MVTPPNDDRIDVLVFTRTAAFRHTSIGEAHAFFHSLSAAEGIRAAVSEDPAHFNDDFLARFEVIAFVNTTGDVLDADQQAAMERFIRSGKGYVGVHAAADTEYDWPWYGRLVGAYFRSHPLFPVAVAITTEDATHPATAHLGETFPFTDEIYNFDRNPRRDNAILLTVDEAGFIYPNTDGGPSMGADHPIAWYKEFEGGRSFYTNLGHQQQSWTAPLFREHLLAGIRWAAQPASFSRSVLTGNARNPLAVAAAPDGRVFYIERTGELRAWLPESGRVVDALVLPVSLAGENGLLGIALDPSFADNGYLYLYYSEPDTEPIPETSPRGFNVLARFTIDAASHGDPQSRLELLRVPSDRINHEGGALAFGPDGNLYLSIGDNTDPFDSNGSAPLDERPGRELYNSQRTAANPFDLRGKILRIRPDGSIPPGNLFPADGSSGRPEIFVMGVRNPFRIAVDPLSGRLFWGDVGPDAVGDSNRGPRGYDEINYADRPGNYGWPYCIGANRPYFDFDFETNRPGMRFVCDDFIPALLAYDYLTISQLALGNALDPEIILDPESGAAFTGRTAIAGVVVPPAGEAPFALPAPFAGTLLMTDWTRDILASVEVSESGELGRVRRLLPWERFRRPIDLDVGPDGALYVLEYGSGFAGDNDDAQLSRIEYSAGGDLSPVAVASAAPERGALPLAVHFSASGSHAAGASGAIVSYEWDVDGDGVVDSNRAEFDHVIEQSGVTVATLVVVTESGRRSLPAAVEVIAGNAPPRVRILEPAAGTEIVAGTPVTLVGEAEDDEDGTIDCQDLQWDIRLGHNAHSHPGSLLRGCSVSFNPTTGSHTAGSNLFYVVELSYTDRGAQGLPPSTARATLRLNLAR